MRKLLKVNPSNGALAACRKKVNYLTKNHQACSAVCDSRLKTEKSVSNFEFSISKILFE